MFVGMGVSMMNLFEADKVVNHFKNFGYDVKHRVQAYTSDRYLVDVTYKNNNEKDAIIAEVDKIGLDFCYGTGLKNELNIIVARHKMPGSRA